MEKQEERGEGTYASALALLFACLNKLPSMSLVLHLQNPPPTKKKSQSQPSAAPSPTEKERKEKEMGGGTHRSEKMKNLLCSAQSIPHVKPA